MRASKRPVRHKPVLTVQQTTDAVDLGRLDRFAQRERRQNRWDPLRNHRFPRARRSDAKNVVAQLCKVEICTLPETPGTAQNPSDTLTSPCARLSHGLPLPPLPTSPS